MSAYEPFADAEPLRRERADLLHAELTIALRRLSAYRDAVSQLARSDPDYAPWARCEQQIKPIMSGLKHHRDSVLPPAVVDLSVSRARPAGRHVVGDLVVDEHSRMVTYHGRQLAIRGRQLDVLAVMARAPSTVFSAKRLTAEVWRDKFVHDDQRARQAVNKMRAELHREGVPKGTFIHNHWGRGWSLTAPAAEPSGPTLGAA